MRMSSSDAPNRSNLIDLVPRKVDGSPYLALIFFHGFSDNASSYRNTWIQRGDPKVCWPKDWLATEPSLAPRIQVLSVSDDGAVHSKAFEKVVEKGKNLLHVLVKELSTERKPSLEEIVLVGYDLGGLVIKRLVVELNKAAKRTARNAKEKLLRDSFVTFKKKLKGIVFYSVPHFRSTEEVDRYVTTVFNRKTLKSEPPVTSTASTPEKVEDKKLNAQPQVMGTASSREKLRIENVSSGTRVTSPEVMIQLQNLNFQPLVTSPAFSREMVQLTSDFENSFDEEINLFAFVESIPTTMVNGQPVEIIPKSSAVDLAHGNFFEVTDAYHFDVCQPTSKSHKSYVKLVDFAKVIFPK